MVASSRADLSIGRRVAAIHQPNFLPWLGFFHKMAMADVFILLDSVPFTKNSFQNRVKIKSAQGEQWLTVPVLTKGRFGQITSQVPINNNTRWRKVHLATLRTNYRRAPYYEEVMAWLEPLYRQKPTHLATFNQSLIEAVMDQLNLPTGLVNASSLISGESGSQLLLHLVQAVGGNVYLSGPTGHTYLDLCAFEQAGVEVWFQRSCHSTYPQLYGDFIPGLSIIDLLMNVGSFEAMGYLQDDSLPFEGAEWRSGALSSAGAVP
jgi:hypothetical protein